MVDLNQDLATLSKAPKPLTSKAGEFKHHSRASSETKNNCNSSHST